jgi:hypothetical protein
MAKKNEFKKSYEDKKVDAKGNKLPEKIGKGINLTHTERVLKQREDDPIVGSFSRIDRTVNNDFVRACKDTKLESKIGQSKKDLVTEILYKAYVKHGDELFKMIK